MEQLIGLLKRWVKLTQPLIVLAAFGGILWGWQQWEHPGQPNQPNQQDQPERSGQSQDKTDNLSGKEPRIREVVQVEELEFTRLSEQEIQISWSGQGASCIREYIVRRRESGRTEWQTLATQACEAYSGEEWQSYTDTLEDARPHQYEYRVDVEVSDEEMYEAAEGRRIFASNILLCIDPGHYEGKNAVNEGGIRYSEGDFTLGLALELQRILKETYGVTACLTRESGTIDINGYTNDNLDGSRIQLRGEYARGSNLFLSLHTNANLEWANGYGTVLQPVEITKPIVIANVTACDNTLALGVGNGIGSRLAEANARMGIAVSGKFQRADSKDGLVQWTDAWNDGLDNPGSICRRTDTKGDYYGVLEGAANVGVPGLIIEHGFHTVPEMRRLAAQGTLQIEWAKADAEGIAEGFGLEKGRED